MTNVLWTDVGPRDGLQNLAQTVPTDVKLRLVKGLLDAGAPRVEATSFVSPKWVPQLADAAEVLQALDADAMRRVRVLVPNPRGLELALKHGAGNVVVTVGATESFNQRNVNRSIEESLEGIADMVATGAAAGCVIDVAVSVCFGCPFEGIVDPATVVALAGRLASLGVAEVCIADTIGVADPRAVAELCRQLLPSLGPDRLALHVHDTRGAGVANVVAAFEVGVRRFEGSAGGLGGCPFAPRSTGNVCSEDAIAALEALGASTGVDLDAYCAVAARLGEDLGMQLPGKLHRAGVWHPERIGEHASA